MWRDGGEPRAIARWRRSGAPLAVLWTLLSLGLAAAFWVSGVRAWAAYLVVLVPGVVSALLWIAFLRERKPH